MTETTFLNWERARTFLGVSRNKMSELIKTGALVKHDHPLDKRIKLFKQSDLDAIKKQSEATK